MSQDVYGLGHAFGRVKITGQASAHLGNRYGDTIQFNHISNANLFTCNASNATPNNETDAGTIAFVQSAELTLK